MLKRLRKFVSTITLSTLALLLVGALAPAVAWAGPASQTQEELNQLKALSGQEFETGFLNMMIMHHQSAIDMSKLAPDRASRQEVKSIAQKIIADQTREIGDMTGWLKAWYNATPQTGMMGGMSGMSGMGNMGNMGNMGMADMAKLQGLKGDDFDKAFLEMMRVHHLGAVEMAKLVPDRATHAELKTLGQNIISAQTTEIAQFDGWLKTWYGADAMGAGGMSGGMSGDMSSLPNAGAGNTWTLLLPIAAILVGAALAGGYWLRKRA